MCSRTRCAASIGVLALALVGCGPDLGTGDPILARQLLYRGGVPYYTGQAMVESHCAGSQCHTGAASGDARTGVPAGLDFDVPVSTPTSDNFARLKKGIKKVREWDADMFAEVDSGSMPPGDAGERAAPLWLPALNGAIQQSGISSLPDIYSSDGQEVLRNWLAAGAPVVAGTMDLSFEGQQQAMTIGDLAPSFAVSLQATWTSIYENIIEGKSCAGCHMVGNGFGTTLFLSRDTTGGTVDAYAALVNVAPDPAGMCAGAGVLVVPGDCRNSLLWQKLQAHAFLATGGRGVGSNGDPMPIPACGAPMPLGAMEDQLSSTLELDTLCNWINMGAMPN